MFGFFSKKKPPAKKPDTAPKKAAGTPVEGKADKAAAKAKAGLEAAAPAPAKAAPQPAPKPISAGDSLERAKAKLAAKGSGGKAALIEQAMAVHQQQAKKLDSLPEETRTRLRAMALKAFVLPGGDKDKSKLN
jgi:hypothetical protein